VLHFCRAELLQQNYFHAVLEASKSVADKLRALVGVTGDGSLLVDATCSVSSRPKQIEARYGVPPGAWCCRVGLTGDPSDGIKDVPGIGPVTAARLLQGGLRLEDLRGSGQLTGRTGQRVLDNLATVIRWRDLARMRTDIPVPHRRDDGPSPPLPAPADFVTLLNLW